MFKTFRKNPKTNIILSGKPSEKTETKKKKSITTVSRKVVLFTANIHSRAATKRRWWH